ncbi:uncharacterized protein PAC_14005 [Phialocephala subalpina]|uniref:Uncharacterized protein n=1 Tax=Phialocephala subalpina TaxID=576137 RepID=A0A1L7XGH5_9HELO|nr:uncharacterized protein PAC_14005 [Phialocephala subalpina]
MKLTAVFVNIISGATLVAAGSTSPDSPTSDISTRFEGNATFMDYARFGLSTELKKAKFKLQEHPYPSLHRARLLPSFAARRNQGQFDPLSNASTVVLGAIPPPLTTLTLDNIGGYFEYNISSAGAAELHVTIWNAGEPTTLSMSSDVSLKALPKLDLIFILDYNIQDLELVSGFGFQCPNGTQILFNEFTGDLVYPSNFEQCSIDPLHHSKISGTGYPAIFLNLNLDHIIIIQSTCVVPEVVFLNTGVDVILVRGHLEINKLDECDFAISGLLANQVEVVVNATVGFQTTQSIVDADFFTSVLDYSTMAYSKCSPTSSGPFATGQGSVNSHTATHSKNSLTRKSLHVSRPTSTTANSPSFAGISILA